MSEGALHYTLQTATLHFYCVLNIVLLVFQHDQCILLGDGRTFGELALLSEDCTRTASIVSDDQTDLIIISRDLYNRSVGKVSIPGIHMLRNKVYQKIPHKDDCY